MAARGTIFAALLILSAALPQSPDAAAPFVLRVAANRTSVQPGAEVVLRVTLRNVSSRSFVAPSMASGNDLGEFVYKVSVTDQRGRPAPRTAYTRWSAGQLLAGNAPDVVLKPGGVVKDELVLTRLVDITAPGNYTVQVWEDWPNFPVVRSNQLKIVVAPPSASAPTPWP